MMNHCQVCGKEISDQSAFCPACGARQNNPSASTQPRTVNLVCKQCSGTMTVDENQRSVICPYCGSKELILESDTVAAERIRSQAQKEVEFKKLEQADKALNLQAEEKRKEEVKKRKLPVVALVFGIISFLISIVNFSTGNITAAFITLIQTVLFVFSFITGKELIGVDFGNVFILSAVAGWVEFIPMFIAIAA